MMDSATATESKVTSGSGAATHHHQHHQLQQQQQQPGLTGRPKGSKRTTTREKIEKMVADGTSNYPAYLKLIYTGDSEEPSSSDDELSLGAGYQPRCHGTPANRLPAAQSRDLESAKLCDNTSEKCRQAVELTTTRAPAASVTSPGPTRPSSDSRQQQNDRISYDDVSINTSSSRDQNESHSCPAEAATQQQQEFDSTKDDFALRQELDKLQHDIATLKCVLNSKLTEASDLRQKLGLTALAEIRHDLFTSLKQSGTFQKTNAALKSLSAYAYRKIGNIRQSVAFRSVGDTDSSNSIRTSRSMGSLRSRLTMLTTSRSESNVAAAAAAAATHTIGDDDDDEEYIDERSTHSQPEM